MNVRKMMAIGGAALASLTLIGMGARATFTDAVNHSQQVTAGTLSVILQPDNPLSGTLSLDQKSLTINPLGPVGSTFDSGAVGSIINNNGTIPANAIVLSASDTNGGNAASTALQSQMWVEVDSWAAPGGPDALVVDEPLTAFEANPIAITGTIPVGQNDHFSTRLHSPVGGLTNAAEGGVVTPTVTVSYQG